MRNFVKVSILVLFVSSFLGFTGKALAYYPTLNVYSSGGSDITMTITGGQPNAQVVITFTPSGTNLPTTTINGMTDYNGTFTTIFSSGGMNFGSQVYATVGGQQVSSTYNGNNGNCGYYGCNVGGFSLSQTSLSLNIGQSASVTASVPYPVYNYTNNVYISSNSNSSVASASVSGNQITVYGLSTGNTTISVCQNSGNSSCASLYVTVGGNNCYYGSGYNCGNNNGSVWFNPSSPTMYVGQSLAVAINSSVANNNAYGAYPSTAYYISSNSNSGVVSASVVGTALNLYASQSGSDNITVCSSGLSFCGTIYVTVNGSGSCGYYGCNVGGLTLSQNNLTLTPGQSASVTVSTGSYIYNGSYYIASNSNGIVASANISGNNIYINGSNSGSTTISVCQSSSSQCVSLYVTVSGSGYYGSGFSLGQTSVALNVNQTASVSIFGSGSYYLSSNTNPSVVSAAISGAVLNLNGLIAGSSVLSVCQTSPSYQCATLYVTVNGYGGGYGNNTLWFNPSSVNIGVGQNASVSITNSNYGYNTGYYISSNNNSYVASASLQNAQLNVYGLTAGTDSVTICQSNGGCGTLYINVGGNSSYYGGGTGLSLSQSNLSLVPNQTATVTVYGNGSYYINSNNNPAVATVNVAISGNVLNVYANGSGNTTVAVCQSNPQTCVNLYITVSGGAYSGGSGSGLQYPGGSGSGGGVLGASSYPSGSLISEGSTVYIVYKNTKTAFASSWAFTGLGYKFSNVIAVGNSGLTDSGYIVTSPYTRHPWGSWIKNGNTVYFVSDSGLIPIPNWDTFLNNGGQANLIVNANSYDLHLPILSVMVNSDPRLQ